MTRDIHHTQLWTTRLVQLREAEIDGWLRSELLKVHDANLICAPRIAQVAGIAALTHPAEHVDRFRDILCSRRQLICERLNALPDIFSYVRPSGAYYVFPRIAAEHGNSWAFAIRLLNDARVSVTPGIAFGPGSDQHVRMAFCVAEEEIDLAFDRLTRYFHDNG